MAVNAPPEIIGNTKIDDIAQDGEKETKAIDESDHVGGACDGKI
jgi:hypothetical protein